MILLYIEMQVNNLPAEIQNKIFYFLEHPIASIIRSRRFIDRYNFFDQHEDIQRLCVEMDQLEIQIRHKLKASYITEEETNKLDPLFLHMNKEIITFIIMSHNEESGSEDSD